VIIISYAGLFIPETYAKETTNWQAQALAQDLFDLFLVTPLLLITAWLAYKKSQIALWLWAGTVAYLIYTLVLYSFAVHFDYLFIIYCLALGLSFYAFLYFMFSQSKEHLTDWITDKSPVKTVGYFFILLAVLFYFLWLSEIIPAILNGRTPASITEAGQITNPVHVLDLSVLLPGLIFIAINLLNRKPWGIFLTPVVLTFLILMTIAIGTMVIVLNMKGLESDISAAMIMGILALFSLFLLVWFIKTIKLKNT